MHSWLSCGVFEPSTDMRALGMPSKLRSVGSFIPPFSFFFLDVAWVLGFFFCWWLLGYVPGGPPFSQLSNSVKDAMVVSTKWWFTSLKCWAKTCKKGQNYNNNNNNNMGAWDKSQGSKWEDRGTSANHITSMQLYSRQKHAKATKRE